MTDIWVKRSGAHDVSPYAEPGQALVDLYPRERPLKMRLWLPRNGATNALYHSILDHVSEAMGISKKTLDLEIKLRAGFVDEYHTEKCGILRWPRSTNFTDCEDEIEFLHFFDKALVVIHGELGIPHDAIAHLMEKRKRTNR